MTARGMGILVAGMHRSGTSALSGSLQRMGVALGDRLIPGASDNPKGYFEHERVVAIHDELFRALGSWWYDPRPLPGGWLETPAARRAEEALAEVLRTDFGGEALWAVKDPRLCRFLPLWRKVLDRLAMPAGALLVLRAPAEVAASLTARNGFGPELGEMLWLRHVLDSVRDTDRLPRTAILYDELMADPAKAMNAALARLGVTPADGKGAQALSGFIEASFRHHTGRGDAKDSPLAALADRVFQSFRRIAAGAGSWLEFETHQRDFDAFWGEVGPAVQAMADAVFPEIEANARLSAEIHGVRAELNAQLRWADEVLEQHRALATQQEAARGSVAAERDALQAALTHARGELSAQVRWAEESLAHRNEQETALLQARSDLAAQVRWAESMVAQRDELRATLTAERDELRESLALARSDLAAQVRWAEAMLEQRDELRASLTAQRDESQASLALARSDLAAQVRWGETMVAQRDDLHVSLVALRDELQTALALARSDLAAQVRWADAMIAQRDELHASLAGQRDDARTALLQARSDLEAQLRWADAMIAQRDELRATLAGQRDELQVTLALARSEAAAQVRLAEQALAGHQSVLAEVQAQAASDAALIERLSASERELAAIKNSFYWRMIRPLRAVFGGKPTVTAGPRLGNDDSNDLEGNKP